jgi:Helix-turn-helix domain
MRRAARATVEAAEATDQPEGQARKIPSKKPKTDRTCLSVAAIARRWGVDPTRVYALIRAGKLPAFTLPSAGRFGEVLRVNVYDLIEFEAHQVVLPRPPSRRPPSPAGATGPRLKHLRQRDGLCRGADHD